MKSTHTAKYEVFREALKRARVEKNITQKVVADLLEVPQSFVSKYESGERRLDVVEFFEIAKALGIDPWATLKEAGLGGQG